MHGCLAGAHRQYSRVHTCEAPPICAASPAALTPIIGAKKLWSPTNIEQRHSRPARVCGGGTKNRGAGCRGGVSIGDMYP